MRIPPFTCLFCLRKAVAFTRQEHPIPESLGNDDWILPPGFVCDGCNQYFGSKVEQRVISEPPFVMERLSHVVSSKKGRVPIYKAGPGLRLISSGYADTAFVHAEEKYVDYYRSKLNGKSGVIPWDGPKAFYLSRFLLKVGLEVLLTSAEDPYSSEFNTARTYAREGSPNQEWQIGYSIYPRRDDLSISTRYDEFGPLVTRQLYEHGVGRLPSGDMSLSFVYSQHIFACNLTRPSIIEHLLGFNLYNEFAMELYRDLPKGKILL